MTKQQIERIKRFLPYLAIGLVVVALGIAGILYVTRGYHMAVNATVQKVRTLGFEGSGTIVVADFRIENPAEYEYVVRKIEVFLDDKDGNEFEGSLVSEVDAKKMFEYYPNLGQKFNDSLLMKSKIPPHSTVDRMIAARFEVPEQMVQSRKNLRIRITELDGVVSEIRERR